MKNDLHPLPVAILDAILYSAEGDTLDASPQLKAADDKLQKSLEDLPLDRQDDILAAVYAYTDICKRAAILLAFHSIDAMRDAAKRPDLLGAAPDEAQRGRCK